jgi:RHS repeat-associated protein
MGIFLTKFSARGSVVYSAIVGRHFWSWLTAPYIGVAVDATGDAFVGNVSSFYPDDPVAASSTDLLDGYHSVSVGEVDPTGSFLVSSTTLPQSVGTTSGIALDSSGGVYVTGSALPLPTTPAAFQTSIAGAPFTSAYTFVAKLVGPEFSPTIPAFSVPGELISTPAGAQGGNPMSDAVSPTGVAYFNGAVAVDAPLLSSAGFGTPWGQDSIWTNAGMYSYGSSNGTGIVDSQIPHLVEIAGDNRVAILSGGTNSRWFDVQTQTATTATYQERFFLTDRLTHNKTAQQFILLDPTGAQVVFWDYSAGVAAGRRGQLVQYVDPYGNVTRVTSYTAAGQIQEVQRSASGSLVESYLYTYTGGLLANVTLRRSTNSGQTWSTIRQAVYTYYGAGDPNGDPGDLQFAKLEDASGAALDTYYYRYYVADETNGYIDGLEYFFDPESYARLSAAVPNPLSATDAQVAPYARDYFQYDSQRRVTLAAVQGAGGAATGGIGTYTYSYFTSYNMPDTQFLWYELGSPFNTWAVKTTETLPDGNANIVYSNYYGEPMMSVYHNQSTGQNWDTLNQFDGTFTPGSLVMQAKPSALFGYDELYASLVSGGPQGVMIMPPGNQVDSEGGTIYLPIEAIGPPDTPLMFSASNLPPGLTIDAWGQITGTITGAGTFSTSITVAAAGYYSETTSFQWTVNSSSATSPIPDQTNYMGDTVSLDVSAAGGGGSYSASGLPPGLTINSQNLITGTIAISNLPQTVYDVQITPPSGPAVWFRWTVHPAVTIAPLPAPSSYVGQNVGLSVSAHDGAGAPLTFSASNLPDGLTINASTGRISGTIANDAAGANLYALVWATDGTYRGSMAFTWLVSGVVAFAPVYGEWDRIGDSPSVTMSATDAYGRPLTYSASNLPPGLSVNSSSGTISGTVAANAAQGSPYDVTLSATDGTYSALTTFFWVITPPGANPYINAASGLITWFTYNHSIYLDPTTGAPPDALTVTVGDQSDYVGNMVWVQATATDTAGLPITSYSATNLPMGLSINSSTGLISGMIMASDAAHSPYVVGVTATDGTATGSTTFDWVIRSSPITVENPGSLNNYDDDPINMQMYAGEANNPPLSFTAAGLPPGLSISAGGLIGGTIAANADLMNTYLVRIFANDGTNIGGTSFYWSVHPRIIVSVANQTNYVGDHVSLQVSAHDTGGVISRYTASNLPNGLSINANTGLITGTVAVGDDARSPYSVIVTASDGRHLGSATFAWTIKAVITVTQVRNQINYVGDTVSLAISASDPNHLPLTYSASNLPPGLAIAAGTDLISGTISLGADAGSPYSAVISVNDGSNTGTMTFVWTVLPGGPGYLTQILISNGYSATQIPQQSFQYYVHSAGGNMVFPLATATVYRNNDGTGAQTTNYAYTWFSATNMPQSVTETDPAITAIENGTGTAAVMVTVNDTYGRAIWHKDALGFIDYTAYDQATGAVDKAITDVNTANTNEWTSDGQTLPSGWAAPSGGGLNLITLLTVDGLGRTTLLVDPNGNATYTVYLDTQYAVRVYPGWNPQTGTTTGPTQVTRDDRANNYLETLTMSAAPVVDPISQTPTGAEGIGSLDTLSRTYLNSAGQPVEKDDYFNLTNVTYSPTPYIGTASSNAPQGTPGSNYYRTYSSYDNRGRLTDTVTGNGTIYDTVYDGLGRVTKTLVGTIQVTANQYDNGNVGDGDLTQVTQFPNDGRPNRVTQYWYDWRDRQVASKQGVQATEDTTTNRPIVYVTYDNLNEQVQTQQYDGDGVTLSLVNGVPQVPAGTLLCAQTATLYDELGQAYQTQVFSVDPTSGVASPNALVTNVYRDLDGQVIAQSNPGGLWSKTAYDGAGRAVAVYATDGAGGSDLTAAEDNVLQETDTTYDADGNAILVVTKQRFNNDNTLGPLANPTTEPLARVYYVGYYFDPANRPIATMNVGTNQGAAWSRPSVAPPPANPANPSNTVLVTTQSYNPAGWLATQTDPRGIVAASFYDNLGRVIETVANYVVGQPQSATQNQVVVYAYDGDNNRTSVQTYMPSGPAQTTAYVYGVTTSNGSGVNSNDILYQVQYPDPSTGNPSSNPGQTMTYTVNALGQNTSMLDRNNTKHAYSYDVLGRQTADEVTQFGNVNVDATVVQLQTAYNGIGQPYLFTSLDANGNVVNQVQDVFNGLGQPVREYQSHSGAVNTSSTPSVQYAYTQMANGASYVNNSRLTSMTYPNGRQINYGYYGIDDTISRLSSVSDSSAVLEEDSYLGLATLVARSLALGASGQVGPTTPAVMLSYIGHPADGGDQYAGLDRFGRVIDQNWMDMVNNVAVSNVQYAYDPDSNKLYANNLVNSAFSELYQYDGFNQLTYFARGVLSASTSSGTLDTVADPSRSMTWSNSPLGDSNQLQITDTTNGNSTQTRGYNQQNQLTSLTVNNTTTAIAYDNNGNLITDQSGRQLYYDAWNRLVKVMSTGNGPAITQAAYQYDALGRRIQETNSNLSTTDVYFNSAGQVIEERQAGAMSAQYVWSPAGGNLLTERDVSPSIYPRSVPARVYVLQDPVGNVVAVVTPSPTVIERYMYDPYGSPTFLTSNWSPVTTVGSLYFMVYLFQGGRFDPNSGNYIFGKRDLNPALGRWMENDPLGFGGGDLNLYRFAGNNPTNYTDPTGEFVPLIIGLGVLAFELYGLYAANEALAQYEAVKQINALPADQHTPALAAEQQQLMQSARWNGAIANVAQITGTAYAFAFTGGLGLSALGAVAPTTAAAVGWTLTGASAIGLGTEINHTVANWDSLDAPGRFEAVGSMVGATLGSVGGFMSGARLFNRIAGILPSATRTNLAFPNGVERVEMSHWIPRRSFLPQWLTNFGWNLKPMWGRDHAINDPFRFGFMPRWWRDANNLNPFIVRQWNRLPFWVQGFGIRGVAAARVPRPNANNNGE